MTRNTIAAMSLPLRLAAIHQAGHAVVGEVCGLECRSLTIIPNEDDGALGHVTHPDVSGIFLEQMEVQMYRHGDPEWAAIKDWVDSNTKCSLAGALAQQRVTGNYDWDGAGRDIQNIADKLLKVYGDEGPDYAPDLCPFFDDGIPDWSKIVRRARELWDLDVEAILTDHWDWVETVAELALEHRTLTGDQVRAVRPSEDFDTDFFY
jgi:hypothetical protein